VKPSAFRIRPITAEEVGLRRAVFFGAIFAGTGLGVWFLARAFVSEGFSFLEGMQLILFALLFHQIVAGCWLALLGGWSLWMEKHPPGPWNEPGLAVAPEHPARTAIVLPMYNEAPGPIFAAAEVLWRELQAAPREFEIFFLSDSNRPEQWIAEERGWFELCRRTGAWGRIHYRKRRSPRHGKSGNLADFCRRWGAHFRYMITLDADSLMTATLVRRLVGWMEKSPRTGILQTLPYQILGQTLFRRMQQFSARMYGPVFAAGANFWHLFAGNYWGHNAIVRIAPFIQFCDLPELPGTVPARRQILSHDTVEAALMRKSGYDVWMVFGEEGSYETGPPNFVDHLAREKRWCRGNLQHFWFLFSPEIDFANRVHIWMGLMAYGAAPLWLLFLIGGALDCFFKHRFSLLSSGIGGADGLLGHTYGTLFAITLGLLFLPKIIGWLTAAPHWRFFGGSVRSACSVVLETLAWAVWAPSIMIYHTWFILREWLGRSLIWTTQNRGEGRGLPFLVVFHRLSLPWAVAGVAGFFVQTYLPEQWVAFSPLFLAWLLTPVLAWWTSFPGAGAAARRFGLFCIPEETGAPFCRTIQPYLQAVREPWMETGDLRTEVFRLLRHPLWNSLHVRLLRARKGAAESRPRIPLVKREQVFTASPEAMGNGEWMELLSDAETCLWLHRNFWKRPACHRGGREAESKDIWLKGSFFQSG